ncbi:ubiquitin-conjugating enzyme E2 U [Psammomys obesus]|uniref:ubiquitin-conjugating enzyme E2 U n=1 Tax=Psammomys obesus TaxID=48139 RepID=UPI002453396A|nr:ubiquitin-conjugating enzyme E2 U [Psammomys obesus]
MYSRAYILLQRDWLEFQHNPMKGITAIPINHDMMSWKAELKGLQNSIWEGFVFDLTIDFTEEYNFVPPVVKFVTIPFHPNVDPSTGQPSIDFLENHEMWDTNYTLSSILLALQVLLSNPILDAPVNLEAARLLMRDETAYQEVTQKLIQPKSPQARSTITQCPERPEERKRIIKKIAFSDYYKKWSEVATSKAAEYSKNPFVGDPNFMAQYQNWTNEGLQYRQRWGSKYWLNKYRVDRKNKLPQQSGYPLVKEMVAASSSKSQSDSFEPSEEWKAEEGSAASWENEVDKLINWTDGLNVNSLDYEE